MRKITLWVSAVALTISAQAIAGTVEVDVHGLTCAFCVDNLQRRLTKLPDVEQVDVSLKTKKVRIVFSGQQMDTEQIKKIVIDSGFTPVKLRIIDDEG